MKIKGLFVMVAVPMLALSMAAQDVAAPVSVTEKVMRKLKTSGSDPDMPNDLGVNAATVVVDVVIGADGKIVKVDPVSGPQQIQGIVVDTVKTWKFKPYMVNGQATPAEAKLSIYMSKD